MEGGQHGVIGVLVTGLVEEVIVTGRESVQIPHPNAVARPATEGTSSLAPATIRIVQVNIRLIKLHGNLLFIYIYISSLFIQYWKFNMYTIDQKKNIIRLSKFDLVYT